MTSSTLIIFKQGFMGKAIKARMAKKVMNNNFMRQKLGNPTEELLTEVTVAVLCGFLMLQQRRFQTKCMITSGTEEVMQIISVLSISHNCSKV
jgi:hypothetical protein